MIRFTALTISALLFMFAFSAHAGLRCTTDHWGNQTCYGTGSDTGYSSRTTTDHWGNTQTYDSNGDSYRCTTDHWGNVTCN